MATSEQFREALKWHLDKKGRGEQAKLARVAGISAPYMNHIVSGRKNGDEDLRRSIAAAVGIEYHDMLALGQWLLDGNEPEVFLEQSGKVFFRNSTMIPPATPAAQGDDQFSISDMITMTAKVLESRTVYRSALASNIRAFHQAVTRESEMEDMRNDMARMQQALIELQAQISRLETGQKKPEGDCGKDADQRKAAG